MNEWFLRRALAIACTRQVGTADRVGRPQVIAYLAERATAGPRMLVTGLSGDTVAALGGEQPSEAAQPVSMALPEAARRKIRYVVHVRRHMFHERRAWRVVLGTRLQTYRLAAWLGDLRLRGFWLANPLRAARMEVLARIAALSAELSDAVAPRALLALADWPQVPRDAAVDERHRYLDRTLAVLVASGFIRKTEAGGFEVQPRGAEALERYDADLQRHSHRVSMRRALNVLVVASGIAALEAGGAGVAPPAPVASGIGAEMSCSPGAGCGSCSSLSGNANGNANSSNDSGDDAAAAPLALQTAHRLHGQARRHRLSRGPVVTRDDHALPSPDLDAPAVLAPALVVPARVRAAVAQQHA
ncbi:hypothetical protein AB4851_10950 [Burkholderia sp. 22PA0099]|uniref:hypothetical protein n=1 Tax=Burkholderia sp. 22PA0099 TaxID=3237372 RepID=UPI0039C3DB69